MVFWTLNPLQFLTWTKLDDFQVVQLMILFDEEELDIESLADSLSAEV